MDKNKKIIIYDHELRNRHVSTWGVVRVNFLYATREKVLSEKVFAAEEKSTSRMRKETFWSGRLPLSGQHVRVVPSASAWAVSTIHNSNNLPIPNPTSDY